MYKRIITLIFLIISTSVFAGNLNKDYALVYIYSPTCPYCQKMAPIVEQIQTEHSMTLYAISQSKAGDVLDMKVGKTINLPLSQDIAHKYYGSNPVRYPLLVLQELNRGMKHYVIASGYTPKIEVDKVLNGYINYFEKEDKNQNNKPMFSADGTKLTHKDVENIKESFMKLGSIGSNGGGIDLYKDNNLLASLNKKDLSRFGHSVLGKAINFSIDTTISSLQVSLSKLTSSKLDSLTKEQKKQINKVLETANKKLTKILRNGDKQPQVVNYQGENND